jgi:hypothetical protein
MRHAVDANTLALWRFDEASATVAVDETGNCSVDTAAGTQAVVAGAFGNGRKFNGDGSLSAPTSAALRTAVGAAGGWTFETWLYIEAANWRNFLSGYETIFGIGDPNTDAWLFAMESLQITGLNSIYVGHSARGYGLAQSNVVSLPADMWFHLGIVCRATGGANYVYDIYVGGAYLGTSGSSGVAPPAGTSAMRIYFGDGDPAGAGNFKGRVRFDDTRISSVERTPAEISASASVAAVDTAAPVVSNVSPTPGSAFTRTTPWLFRVTDDTAFRRVIVTATLNGIVEVVWDGSAFVGGYTPSTRTEVVADKSYDFSVRRLGGWLYAPTFNVYAIDTAGNEGT